MIQGALLPAAYEPFAQYFVKYVQAYEAAGVPIHAVTPENEPLNIPGDYPGSGMTAGEQIAFIRDHLGPAFRDAKLKTKILVFDHNWDLIESRASPVFGRLHELPWRDHHQRFLLARAGHSHCGLHRPRPC